MNSYVEKLNRYWDLQQNLYTSMAQSQIQSLMQPVPVSVTTAMTPKTFESFMCASNTQESSNRQDDMTNEIKSAFKPVKPRSSRPILNSDQAFYSNEMNYSPPTITNSATANGLFNYAQPPAYDCIYDLQSNDNNMASTKPEYSALSNASFKSIEEYNSRHSMGTIMNQSTMNDMSFRGYSVNGISQARQINQNNQIGNVFHWETLLPVVPEPTVPKDVSMRKNVNTPRRQRSRASINRMANSTENPVPIIDLTSNDDFQPEQQRTNKNETAAENTYLPTTVIELNQTPPLDANGNEILITTDTKSMQAITFKKQKSNSSELHNLLTNNIATNELNPSDKQLTHLDDLKSRTATFKHSTQMENYKAIYANYRYNGIRIPPKKQIKLIAKHSRWQRQLRTYNGFRLFARRNRVYAQRYASESDNETIVNNTLLKWWNSVSTSEKEHYAHVAEVICENRARSSSNVFNDNKQQNDFNSELNAISNEEKCDNTVNVSLIENVIRKESEVQTNHIIENLKSVAPTMENALNKLSDTPSVNRSLNAETQFI